MGGGDVEALKKQTQTWMIIGIVCGLICGCNLICWVGAVLAYLGSQSAQRGDIPDAQSKLKIAKIVTIVGVGLSLLGFIIWFALSGLSILSNM